jgi:hypothetical protein
LVTPPGVEVAVYAVITEPPFEAGAVKSTVAVRFPVAVTVPIVGAPGAVVEVVMELEAKDADDAPIEFKAVMVKV